MHSEDEFDQDTQSLDEKDAEDEEANEHLSKAFRSTFNRDMQKEIQEVTDKQGLSPRGRKGQRLTSKQPTTSTSAKSSRPTTRSKSRGV